jgi:hypothetical protein
MSVVPLRKRHIPLNGGDVMPNIVETMYLDKVVVHIASDHMAKTPAEIDAVLAEHARVMWSIWNNLSREEQEEWNRGS